MHAIPMRDKQEEKVEKRRGMGVCFGTLIDVSVLEEL